MQLTVPRSLISLNWWRACIMNLSVGVVFDNILAFKTPECVFFQNINSHPLPSSEIADRFLLSFTFTTSTKFLTLWPSDSKMLIALFEFDIVCSPSLKNFTIRYLRKSENAIYPRIGAYLRKMRADSFVLGQFSMITPQISIMTL